MRKVELDIVAISHSLTQSQSYVVVLGEKEGVRRLPVIIGGFEAQAIAVAIEKMTTPRPQTHDLLYKISSEFEIKLREIVISNLRDGIFFATLICENNGNVIEFDSRTSDALALAVRFECPIYTYEFILERAGIVFDNPNNPTAEEATEAIETVKKEAAKVFANHSIDKLNSLLNDALANEDYETAALIRDEIKKKGD